MINQRLFQLILASVLSVVALADEVGQLVLPIDPQSNAVLLSGFGPRKLDSKWKLHAGIDVATQIGEFVHSVSDGVVKLVDFGCPNHGRGMRRKDKKWQCGDSFGNRVAIEINSGEEVLYAHLNPKCPFEVIEGQRVRRSDIIGCVGNSGSTYGPHLHFEVHAKETLKPTDPLPFLGSLAAQYQIGKLKLKKQMNEIVARIELANSRSAKARRDEIPADFYQGDYADEL